MRPYSLLTTMVNIIRSLYNLFHNLTLKPNAQTELQGDFAVRGSITTLALATPGTPTVTPQGTAGATAYGYKIVATVAGRTTPAGAEGTTASGNAALSAGNFNRVTWSRVPGATGYKVYRTTGGATQGLISTLTSGATLSLDDTGLAGGGETPPTVNTTGHILTARDVRLQALTTAQRDALPTAALLGALIFNTENSQAELYDGFWRTPGLRISAVQFTRANDAASQAGVAVTGVGFRPRAVFFIWNPGAGSSQAARPCMGFANPDLSGACHSFPDGFTVQALPNPIRIYTDSGNGALYQLAAVASFDADGFTLNWTREGSSSGGTTQIMAIAIG
ncbi:MAG: hypothetical protein HY673_03970 [Chloroflexi bacterium]|nr:hypothetical protein [Chloroflexota bacterium]